MNPFTLGVSALVALLMLSSRKAEAASPFPFPPLPPPDPEPLPPSPEPSAGCGDNVMLSAGLPELVIYTPVPGGWRRVRQPTSELIAFAQQMLAAHSQKPYGSLFVHPSGQYAAMVEQHCHDPQGAVGPRGRHHGITLLAKA